jgi:ATP-dependent DNA helicase PIF1
MPPAAAIPPTALPQYAPYTDYIPLRYALSINVPGAYPAQSHAASSLPPGENAPPTAVTHTAGELKTPRKRKHDEEHDIGHDKRLRADGFSMKSAMQVSRPSRAQAFGELLKGTQHNPLEIESSPEPEAEAKAKGPSRRPPMSAGQSGLPQDLRNAGLYVQKPDLTAKKVKYYAVPGGKVPGIYTDYDIVLKQVKGYSGAKQRGFRTEDEAWAYMNEQRSFVQIAVQRQKERTEVASYSPQPKHCGSMAQPIPSSVPPPYTYASPTPSSERSSASAKELVRLADGRGQQITAPPANQQPAKALETDFVSEPEPSLSAEQQHVVDLIVGGHNVFYTGSAGCGKSTILKAFVKKLRETAADGTPGKRVRIVAPTNLAALNVNGQTTWNFAGWTPDSMKKPLDKLMAAAHGDEVWERFNTTDVLVLDEISMVENLQFERLNEVMKAGIGEKYGGGPFGGIQVVVTGDVSRSLKFVVKILIVAVLSIITSKTLQELHRMWLGTHS